MSETRIEAAAAPGASGTGENLAQYLTFLLAGEQYGVDILRVQEIKGWEGVTRVPYTPPFLLGVMNLRGSIVPVIDLRARFGLEPVAFGSSTVVIVVRAHLSRGEKTVGLVVDGVSDVHDLAAGEIKPPPQMCGQADTAAIGGLASAGDTMVMLLDVDRLVGTSLESDASNGRTH